MLNVRLDLVDKVSAASGYHKYEVEDVLNALTQVMKEEFLLGNEVQFLGVGKLFVKPIGSRNMSGRGLPPRTVQTGPTLRFKASRVMQDQLKEVRAKNIETSEE